MLVIVVAFLSGSPSFQLLFHRYEYSGYFSKYSTVTIFVCIISLWHRTHTKLQLLQFGYWETKQILKLNYTLVVQTLPRKKFNSSDLTQEHFTKQQIGNMWGAYQRFEYKILCFATSTCNCTTHCNVLNSGRMFCYKINLLKIKPKFPCDLWVHK